jgi:hypothetical protein
MDSFIKKSGFRFWVHAFMVLLVLGLFVVACGGSNTNTTTTYSCRSGYVLCNCTHSQGVCCPSNAHYYAESNCGSGYSAGSCYSSVPNCTYCNCVG